MKNLKWKLFLIAVTIGLALWFSVPPEEKIKLGLDLQGGMHLVLEAEADKAIENAINRYSMEIKRELQNKEIDFRSVKRNKNNQLVIKLYNGSDAASSINDLLKDYQSLKHENSQDNATTIVYKLKPKEIETVTNGAIDQALETIRNRIDEFGVSEPTIQKQGKNRILIQLPGIQDTKRAIDLIGKTAILEFKLVNENLEKALAGEIPEDTEIVYEKIKDKLTGKELSKKPFLLQKEALMTGEYITHATIGFDRGFNEPYVSIQFDKVGSKLFADITRKHVKKRLAIVLDGNVYSAPSIREEISGGRAQISGSFTDAEARDLAIVLRAGSLPVPVKILENRTVGASLGQDSVDKGKLSIFIGGATLLLFMLAYYKISGIIANVALLLNILLIAGALASLGATLTLPGIAGIILTLGMAVDANVLIFERIKEEMHIGKSVRASVDSGFSKAFLTIVDANITTLIAAVVLIQFGTGPIRGFAITLGIGILASMFTACFVSKVIFDIMLRNKNITKLSI